MVPQLYVISLLIITTICVIYRYVVYVYTIYAGVVVKIDARHHTTICCNIYVYRYKHIWTHIFSMSDAYVCVLIDIKHLLL